MGRGRPILPPMPIPMYKHMTDDDLEAVYTYLQSIPAIRNQVDLEGAALVRKPEAFADRVLNQAGTQAPLADPEAEKRRLAEIESARRATGGDPVTIKRADPERFKLPGL
jgi:hypothetical protein